MTEKLYDKDSELYDFEAKVISCGNKDGRYKIGLNKTAFFPESGGQRGDTGKIDGINVYDTQYDGDRIVHITEEPVEIGKLVACSLDREGRFRRMQNHTGEHIVSSIMYRRYGFSNVGFHIGDDGMTFDISGEISAEQLADAEREANSICVSNARVSAYYPVDAELAKMTYRSKGGLSGDVRIVEIEGVDMCACCAPHVRFTGEIGMIKILGFIRYKGGIRIWMKCGFDALDDFRDRIAREEKISSMLCVPQPETADGVTALFSSLEAKKKEIYNLKKALAESIAGGIAETDGNVCVFCDNFEPDDLRALANLCAEKCRIFAALSPCEKGYVFVCASRRVPLKPLSPMISDIGGGRCGGSDLMLTGKLGADEKTLGQLFGRL